MRSRRWNSIEAAEQARDRAAVALADAVLHGRDDDEVQELTARYAAALDKLERAWKAWGET
jgi:hypothetical protein